MGTDARIVRSAKVISALTLASRVLGLFRDILCAVVFAVGGVMDAFSIGFMIPNLFRRLFGEGALSASSIPRLSEALHHGGEPAVDHLARRLLGALFVVLIGLTLLGEGITAGLAYVVPPSPRNHLILLLTAILLPYAIPVCASAILGGIQNVLGQFAVPAANPVVLNLCMITALLTSRCVLANQPREQVLLLAGSVLVAGVIQLVWQWIATRRRGLVLRTILDLRDPMLRNIAVGMLPMMVGLGAAQLNVLTDSMIAVIFAPKGGPAALYFAQRLYQFPLGVFTLALATAIFPALSRFAAANDRTALRQTYERGIRLVLFEGLPCTIGLVLIRYPVIQALLQHGEFDAGDTARVARTLFAYAAGIWAFGLNHILVRTFYAMQDARTPMRIASAMVGLNLVLNLILVHPLQEAGLALSTSICGVLQAVLLARSMNRALPPVDGAGIWRPVTRTIAATALMGLAVIAVDAAGAGLWAHAGAIVELAALVITGAAAYVLAGWLVRCPELQDVLRRR